MPDAPPHRDRFIGQQGCAGLLLLLVARRGGCRRKLAEHSHCITLPATQRSPDSRSSTSTNSIPSTSSSVSRPRSRPDPVACAGLRPAHRKAFISIFSLFCNKLLSTTISKKKKKQQKYNNQTSKTYFPPIEQCTRSVTKNDREEPESAPLHAPLHAPGREVGPREGGGRLREGTQTAVLPGRVWVYGKKCNRSNIETCNSATPHTHTQSETNVF